MNSEIQALSQLLRQMEELLTQIDPANYAKPLPAFNGSSIGGHFRHVYDFFSCLEKGLATGEVDYGTRTRDPQLEKDPKALAVALSQSLNQLKASKPDQPLRIRTDVSTEQTNNSIFHKSCLGRELLFVHSHAVHHLAIIKIGLQSLDQAIELNKDLGIAPSTIIYQASRQNNG